MSNLENQAAVNENLANEDEKDILNLENIVEEHEEFVATAGSRFISSNELCAMVSGLFSSIYADFEGCTFEIMKGTNVPVVSLYFNHREDNNAALPYACSKEDRSDRTRNNTLRNTRLYSSRLVNGDRYYLTSEGKGLGAMVIDNPQLYKKNGSVIWSKIISEVADSNMNINGHGQQYTKVTLLDPQKLVGLIYGKDGEGAKNEYFVNVLRSIPNISFDGGVGIAGYMLEIKQISVAELEKHAQKWGIAVQSSLNIIR